MYVNKRQSEIGICIAANLKGCLFFMRDNFPDTGGLSKEVIAEGVKVEEQVRILRNLQYKKIQGYYLSKPLFRDEANKFLGNQLRRVKKEAQRNS